MFERIRRLGNFIIGAQLPEAFELELIFRSVQASKIDVSDLESTYRIPIRSDSNLASLGSSNCFGTGIQMFSYLWIPAESRY